MKHVSQSVSPAAPPKVLLFDMDGTLVRSDHTIDPRVVARLQMLEKSGVVVGFATGRALFGATRVIEKVPVNGPSMFFSGSLVCHPQSGEVLFEEGMEATELIRLIDAASKANLYLELYTRSGYFISEWNVLAELHSEYMGELPQVGDLSSLITSEKILKAVVIGEDGISTDQVFDLVKRESDIPCGVSYGAAHPGIVFANFTSRNASRPRALQVITKALEVTESEVASFGDAVADLEFITRVGFGVAMGNANDEVKRKAPFVTDGVDGDGVLTALDWLFPSHWS
jgi:Cof subfamily protein (haloacid dehalogenase superfamily)